MNQIRRVLPKTIRVLSFAIAGLLLPVPVFAHHGGGGHPVETFLQGASIPLVIVAGTLTLLIGLGGFGRLCRSVGTDRWWGRAGRARLLGGLALLALNVV